MLLDAGIDAREFDGRGVDDAPILASSHIPTAEPYFYRTATDDHWMYRAMDVTLAAIMLLVAAPMLLLLAIALKIDSPGPLLFVHRRIGRGGMPFSCYKLRTMCVDANAVLAAHLDRCATARAEWAREFKLVNDPRVTRLGKIVRKYSLDEFPQLINVLRGEMSIVGPRPIITAEIPLYGTSFNDFCAVRPGLTGLWQVSGRNHRSYQERVALDRFYVQRKSLLLDLSIIVRTVETVTSARGAY